MKSLKSYLNIYVNTKNVSLIYLLMLETGYNFTFCSLVCIHTYIHKNIYRRIIEYFIMLLKLQNYNKNIEYVS